MKGRPPDPNSLASRLRALSIGGTLIVEDAHTGDTATRMERSVTSAVAKDKAMRERTYRTERLLGVRPHEMQCIALLRVYRES